MKLALTSVALLLLVSCATVTVTNPKQAALVGQWLYADEVQRCRYSFAANGTFSGEVRLHGREISRFTGRWNVEGDRLLYTYIGDTYGRIPPGARDQDRLLEVTTDSFFIEAANGERRRYRRVR